MAATEGAEQAGGEPYRNRHTEAIFREGLSFSGFERDLLSLNLGTRKFLDISGVSGLDSVSDGRGAVFADFDNDGDLDIFLTTIQGEAHLLFRNNVGSDNGFLRVELEGGASGRDAYGAIVRVKTLTGTLTKVKSAGSGYLSQHDQRLLFGLSDARQVREVEVTWPSGAVDRPGPVPAGTAIRIVEGRGGHETVAERHFRLPDPLSRAETMLAKLGFRKGEPFPDLRLRALDGRETRLARLRRPGQRTLVNLWATYCVPCAKEMPELQNLRSRLGVAGIDLVGVSIDTDTADQIPAYLARLGITYPIYATDQGSVSAVFPKGEVLIPASFLLDGRGLVLEALSGWSDDSRSAIARWLGRGNTGPTDPHKTGPAPVR